MNLGAHKAIVQGSPKDLVVKVRPEQNRGSMPDRKICHACSSTSLHFILDKFLIRKGLVRHVS